MSRRLVAEALGTGFLLAAVVGSGIMAERLAGGNNALALLGNTLATGAILVVLILIFGPVSGAHLNPAVTLAFRLKHSISTGEAGAYILVQVGAAILGVWAAHLMFETPVVQYSAQLRTGPAQWFAEFIAAFGLVMTILGCLKARPESVPMAVGLYISAAYWFTSSTSFANPAVTLARSLTDSFSGIFPAHVPAFIVAQMLGAVAATAVGSFLFDRE